MRTKYPQCHWFTYLPNGKVGQFGQFLRVIILNNALSVTSFWLTSPSPSQVDAQTAPTKPTPTELSSFVLNSTEILLLSYQVTIFLSMDCVMVSLRESWPNVQMLFFFSPFAMLEVDIWSNLLQFSDPLFFMSNGTGGGKRNIVRDLQFFLSVSNDHFSFFLSLYLLNGYPSVVKNLHLVLILVALSLLACPVWSIIARSQGKRRSTIPCPDARVSIDKVNRTLTNIFVGWWFKTELHRAYETFAILVACHILKWELI